MIKHETAQKIVQGFEIKADLILNALNHELISKAVPLTEIQLIEVKSAIIGGLASGMQDTILQLIIEGDLK